MTTGWTTAELRLLRLHYPRGGSAACAQVLHNRSPVAIQRRARRDGLLAPTKGLSKGRKHALNAAQLVAISKALRRGLKYGDFARLGRQLGLPPWVVEVAARKMAGQPTKAGRRPWSAAADRLLIARADWSLQRLAARLAAMGEPRTCYAIHRRSRKIGAARDEAETCTAAELSRRLGLPPDVVSRWILAGRLQAKRRPPPRKRTDRHDKPGWWGITDAAVRDLMRAEPALLAQLLPGMAPAARLWMAEIMGELPEAETIKRGAAGRNTRGLPAHWMEAA